MNYEIRNRPDGQVELIELRPALVAVFADADIARQVATYLYCQSEEQDSVPTTDAAPEGGAEEPPAATPTPTTLPAVVAQSDLPAAEAPTEPSEADWERAFGLIAAGEKLTDVAKVLRVPWTQLRGKYAAHRQREQKAAAAGGQVDCVVCGRPFTPSLSSPDKCARCARD